MSQRRFVVAATLLLVGTAVAYAAAGEWTWYVGDLGPRHVLLAWGQPVRGRNSIGRGSQSWGKATVTVGPRRIETEKAWARVDGLEPDQSYPYKIEIAGTEIANGTVRTYAEKASRVSFLVMGDYGDGHEGQLSVARKMAEFVRAREKSGNPIRFVVTTGDNIYSLIPGLINLESGDEDVDWWPKFFVPYADVIHSIPFRPSPGNHDGNQQEKRKDLEVYLDNFFFPGGTPERWYSFQYGGLAEFFALDTTKNTLSGPKKPQALPGGPQSVWLEKALSESKAVWKIPFFHHPIFSAGPYHEPNDAKLDHWATAFQSAGVRVAFSGHEHNFQISAADAATGGIRYVISGAGGELRGGDVRKDMPAAHIAAWAPVRHFLAVDIDGTLMSITMVPDEDIRPVDAQSRPVPMPFEVRVTQ